MLKCPICARSAFVPVYVLSNGNTAVQYYRCLCCGKIVNLSLSSQGYYYA